MLILTVLGFVVGGEIAPGTSLAQTPVDDDVPDELLALTGDDDLQAVLAAQQPHSQSFIADAIAADES